MNTYQLDRAIRYCRLTSVERAYVRGQIAKRPPSRRIRLWLKRNSGQPTERAIRALKCARKTPNEQPGDPELDALFRDFEKAIEQGASQEQLLMLFISLLAHPRISWLRHSRHHSASKMRKKIWRVARTWAGYSSTEIASAFNVSKRAVNKALMSQK